MKRWLAFVCAAAAIAASPSAHATVITATFSGQEILEAGPLFYFPDLSVSGSFAYDTASNSFTSFTVGGVSLVAPYSSSVGIHAAVTNAGLRGPLTEATYQAVATPAEPGGTITETFELDLVSLTTWPSGNAISLLTNTNQLTTNLDTVNNPLSTDPSTFDIFIANTAGGLSVNTVLVDLTTLSISTAVPEPASLAMLAAGLLGLGFIRRRCQAPAPASPMRDAGYD